MKRNQGGTLGSLDRLAAERMPPAEMPVDIPRARSPRPRRRWLIGGLGLLAVVAVVMALRGTSPAAPTVERAHVFIDSAQTGPMVREVLGQGALVPQEVRWVSARTNVRVERILVQLGASVQPDTVIFELANSDLELQTLEADRQLAQAEAELVNLQATLNGQRLGQASLVASLRSELDEAKRRARADQALARKGFLSDLELGQTQGRATELEGRLRFERLRQGAQARGGTAQIEAQKAQVDRLRSIAEFRRKEVQDLKLRAGVAGVLQALSVQPGQTVAAGTLLAKITNPTHLKAEVKVGETQAKDVAVGQKAIVDTHNGLIHGHVAHVDPAAQAGTVLVDVALEGTLPPGARPDLNVEASIEIERLAQALTIGRPAIGQPGAVVGLFKVDADRSSATRTPVHLGATSIKSVQVLEGLKPGDQVIISDMSQWDRFDRIRLR